MEDVFFRNLTWDEDHRWWRGVIIMPKAKTAKLTIDDDKTDVTIPETLRNSTKLLIANESLIRDKIAVSMSQLYNGTWGGGETITLEELAQRITLTHVSFYEEGDGELFYEAYDDLFTDQTICASIDGNGEIGEPELAG
jgi:hypothetical protein